ncbi:hypothetical protein THIOM_002931 [Candidatus Thiomargarita nelsonii]|uniref:Uncharacterized protein n=1 Tax=Candidatus Thiomargarita nelsonii TaxID=1003181 RepID=A0A176S032_9GAMM|nr:hypothetical protein THIOM_002931 [Candidatus Thiomargarita nelsonii]
MSENNFLNILEIQRVISRLSQLLIQIDKSMQNWLSGVGYLKRLLVMFLKAHFWQWICVVQFGLLLAEKVIILANIIELFKPSDSRVLHLNRLFI